MRLIRRYARMLQAAPIEMSRPIAKPTVAAARAAVDAANTLRHSDKKPTVAP
jgi:hypothetical protein